jgi:hypothetical protein
VPCGGETGQPPPLFGSLAELLNHVRGKTGGAESASQRAHEAAGVRTFLGAFADAAPCPKGCGSFFMRAGVAAHARRCTGWQETLLPVSAPHAHRRARERRAQGEEDARPQDGYRASAEALGDFDAFDVYAHMRDVKVKVKRGLHGPGSAEARHAWVRSVDTAKQAPAAGREGAWALVLAFPRLVCRTMESGARPQAAAATVARRTERLAAGEAVRVLRADDTAAASERARSLLERKLAKN